MKPWRSRHARSRVRHAALARVALSLVLPAAMSAACKPEPARAPAPLEPDRIVMVEGSIRLDNGQELAYRATLAPDPAARGQHLGTIDIPKQALSAASLDWAWFEAGEKIEFTLALPGTPRWTGRYEADGSIACEFRQAALWLPCTMRDVSAHHAPRAVASEGAPPSVQLDPERHDDEL
jgi:hypothetical protein